MPTEEKPFRLRPRRRTPQRTNEVRIWSAAFKRLIHVVRMSSRRMGRVGASARPWIHNQRCAVRVSYSANKAPGQWRAHGRYVARESATNIDGSKGTGFGPGRESIDVAGLLGQWQNAGDERMFKLIISPEFGERMDLEAHTRALMTLMEQDLGTTLEWVAVAHFNTSHPHVHIALRGITDRGQALHLERDYIRLGIRRHAEDLCMAQLGYRTGLDAEEAQRREIDQCRYTSLDRLIHRNAQSEGGTTEGGSHFRITVDPSASALRGFLNVQQHHVSARLLVLEKMGLAEPGGSGTWHVRRDFEDVLRAMQRASDHQKTLVAHGALLSDQRLPLQVTPLVSIGDLEGRVVGHGQDDSTGRAYVLIEGTDAKVHFIYQENSIETARHRGLMRINSFVRLRKGFSGRRAGFIVDDLGDAEKLLDSKRHTRNLAQRLIKRGGLPDEMPAWGGWLGRYQATMQSQLRAFRETATKGRDRETQDGKSGAPGRR